MSHCDSQNCILVQEEQGYLENGDPLLTENVYFLSLGHLITSHFICGDSTTMKLDDSILNCSFIMLCLTLPDIYFLCIQWV